MTAVKREPHELCEYHAELAENQADIKESQAQIQTHLLWLRGAGKWGLGLLGGCLMVLLGIGGTVLSTAWNLSLTAQANRAAIVQIETEVKDMKAVDKDICVKLDKLQREQSKRGVRTDRDPWSE